ncbi:hypothetical protein SERLA73DRAFT_153197 [Serpula lacrymans var. lacrymans S7.3]|uniref:Uncharacterized protein n=1 Tax=Serpula lacrymans var. lacrymans (strain S7.3) TaxID=936435 RepID=F8Q0Y8_SERL3|nr:hypothetical protein SERLA73DRAFT_153197 [Serpula lacrymans var. lacrymans S7.3]
MNVLLKKKELDPPVHHLVQIQQFHGLTNGLVVLDHLVKKGSLRERSSLNLKQHDSQLAPQLSKLETEWMMEDQYHEDGLAARALLRLAEACGGQQIGNRKGWKAATSGVVEEQEKQVGGAKRWQKVGLRWGSRNGCLVRR